MGETNCGPGCGGEPPCRQTGKVATPAGDVPRIDSRLGWRDHLGHWRVRWGIGRHRYRIPAGLYALTGPDEAAPDARSPVLVTANFKMSFDRLRSSMAGRTAWILVLDTCGINVWCAAGKGTFGTEELLERIEETRLARIVDHRRLILPQLAGPGVSAPAVREKSGWRVVYGPVRAADLPAFLDARCKATPEMRRVNFPLGERLALIPIELVGAARYVAAAAVVLWLLSGLGGGGFSLARTTHEGPGQMIRLLSACLAGTALTPALLPWLPGRAFSTKGLWAGLVVMVIAGLAITPRENISPGLGATWTETASWVFLGTAIASFLAMNFTGASTYTSLSGVRREMRIALPAQIGAAACGLLLWLAGRVL